MPITWTAEADAKVPNHHNPLPITHQLIITIQTQLLLGFLDQCKDANFKLDYNKLAAYVGPGMCYPLFTLQSTKQ